MLSRICCFLAILGTAFGQNSASIANCDSSSIFKIQSLDIQPAVPVKGENVTTTVVYDAPIEVTEGVASYSCTLNGIPFKTSDDLCTQTSCPKMVGTHTEISNADYSSVSGKIVCEIKWVSKDSSQTYMCIKSTVRISNALRGSRIENFTMPTFELLESEPLASNAYSLCLVPVNP